MNLNFLALKNEFKSMIIKYMALWLLENTELLLRGKHDKIFQQHTKTQNNIMLLWYEFKL